MKKFYTVTMMLFFLVSVISAQNLVLNPGFESWDNATTPTDWTHVESVDQESVEVHSGTYSAKHTGGTKDLGQTIPVTGGLTYHLSLWYKVASGDGSDARIWSYWQDEGANLNDNAAELRGPNNSYLPGSTEWQQYSCVVTAPDTATDLYLEVRTYSGAVVYWDDFLLEETAADTEPPVWTAEYPKVIPSHQRVGFALVASMDEPGVVSYVVVPDGSAAPSVAEVIAGVDYGTVTVTTAGTIIVPVADTDIPQLVDAVSEDTDYDVYLVAADDEAVPNTQDAAVMLDVTTILQPVVLLYSGFDIDLTPFTPVSVSGDQVWNRSSSSGNGFAKISGYVSGTSYVNEDWLISPAVDLAAATGEYLSFETANNYGDANTTLKVMISSDFS
ncbi:MAG: carbohydrate binding domain-containing protein, partial [Bacteroidales bacterium]|nr:carbohydrate binding domain-containing protein [Bacteroidales bacterium]